MADLRKEIEKRRTFAIISHPDAGKTTLTEKFLLYGGAINLAGSVKGKATAQVMQCPTGWRLRRREVFPSRHRYCSSITDGYCINILDTPGHQDFSEDTYRTLMAADSAVMVIDGIQGCRGADQKAVQGLCDAPYSDFYIHQQDGPRCETTRLSFLMRSRRSLALRPARSTGRSVPVRILRVSMTAIQERLSTFSDTLKGTKEGTEKHISVDDPALIAEIGQDAYDTADGGDRASGRSERGV